MILRKTTRGRSNTLREDLASLLASLRDATRSLRASHLPKGDEGRRQGRTSVTAPRRHRFHTEK
ncbi:hypothetical protein [Nostoc sp.]|uniref:hypothetical protein n=1 Tax=Nostoc sp. TaxID=1180 RepID=UPI002FF60BC0